MDKPLRYPITQHAPLLAPESGEEEEGNKIFLKFEFPYDTIILIGYFSPAVYWIFSEKRSTAIGEEL